MSKSKAFVGFIKKTKKDDRRRKEKKTFWPKKDDVYDSFDSTRWFLVLFKTRWSEFLIRIWRFRKLSQQTTTLCALNRFCLFNATRFINHEPATTTLSFILSNHHFLILLLPTLHIYFAGGLSLHRQLKSRCLHADSSAPAYIYTQTHMNNIHQWWKMMLLKNSEILAKTKIPLL